MVILVCLSVMIVFFLKKKATRSRSEGGPNDLGGQYRHGHDLDEFYEQDDCAGYYQKVDCDCFELVRRQNAASSCARRRLAAFLLVGRVEEVVWPGVAAALKEV